MLKRCNAIPECLFLLRDSRECAPVVGRVRPCLSAASAGEKEGLLQNRFLATDVCSTVLLLYSRKKEQETGNAFLHTLPPHPFFGDRMGCFFFPHFAFEGWIACCGMVAEFPQKRTSYVRKYLEEDGC